MVPTEHTNPRQTPAEIFRHDATTGRLGDDLARMVWIPEELVQALHAVANRLLHPRSRGLLEAIGMEWGAALGARLDPPNADDSPTPEAAAAWAQQIDDTFVRYGLGRLSLRAEGGHLVLHTHDSFEGRALTANGRPACHVTNGLLADLFGALYGRDLSCVETRCRSCGHHHCTFVLDVPAGHGADHAGAIEALFGAIGHGGNADTAEVEIQPSSATGDGRRSNNEATAFIRLDPVSGTATSRDGTGMFLAPDAFLVGLLRATDAHPHAERLRYQLGYDWGIRHFRNTERAIAAHAADEPRIANLPIGDFVAWLDRWMNASGWGRLALVEDAGRIFVRLDHSALAAARGSLDHVPLPLCHLWTGMFAGTFSGATGTTLACTEVQCAATGAADCRFLLDVDEIVAPIRRLVARSATFEQVLRALTTSIDEATPNTDSANAEVPR